MRHVILLASVLLTGCGAARGSESLTVPAKSGSTGTPYAATAVGRIDSASEARHLAASVDGVIAAVPVERGDRVRAGQILLKVDCGQRLEAVAALNADAERAAAAMQTVHQGARTQEIAIAMEAARAAEAGVDEARDRYRQAQALLVPGFVSKRDLASRANVLTEAEAQHRAALAKADLLARGPRTSERREAAAAALAAREHAKGAAALTRQCNLVSPIDGEVVQVLRREGEFSGATMGTPLIVVADLSRLVVRAEITERDAAAVALGQRVEVWIEGQPRRWQGAISGLAGVMGRRSARSLDPSDRFDRDVREAIVTIQGKLPPRLVGLRVMVGLLP